jgi:PASTA domain-containing protein
MVKCTGSLAALAVLAAVGCGDSETVTVTEKTVIEQAAPAPDPAPEKRQGRKRDRQQAAEPAPAADGSGGGITVPNVVGQDHQLAQDTMQSAGLYLLDERDCTGQDRLLLWDRNWVVVEQDPPAGSQATEDTVVTLCSKKRGE